MAYWWVNQKQTHHLEHAEGYLWAPLKDKAGKPNKHWELMELVEPGDLIFSYVNAKISKIAVLKDKLSDERLEKEELENTLSEYLLNENEYGPLWKRCRPNAEEKEPEDDDKNKIILVPPRVKVGSLS